jgi:hypothetical protein
MIPSYNTNNTRSLNVRPNTAATQEGQASTNTSLTTTNWSNNFTVAPVDNPGSINMATNPATNTFARIVISIGVLSRFIVSAVAEPLTNSIVPANINSLNANNLNSTFTTINSPKISLLCLVVPLGIGLAISAVLILRMIRGNSAEPQPQVIDKVTKFCNLIYENLPVADATITEFKDTQCPICLSNFDKSASRISLNSIDSNESTDTKGEWVMYEKQLYHLKELQKAVSTYKRIPHTQQDPDPSQLQAVKIVQALNNTPTTSNESTAKKSEIFIVDVPDIQDTSQFTANDNDEENTAF